MADLSRESQYLSRVLLSSIRPYRNHTLQAAVETVHVLQHILKAGCDIADKEFALVLEV